MSIADLRALTATNQDMSRSNDGFRRRVAVQQFLNDFAPLLSVAALGGNPDDFGAAITRVEDISRDIAASLGTSEDDGENFRACRIAAARALADSLTCGGSSDAYVASIIGSIERLPELEYGTTQPFPKMSNETSLAMTAMNCSAQLAVEVQAYCFGQDPARVLKRLVQAVVEYSIVSAGQFANPSEEAYRSVLQTIANKSCDIMAGCYERVARQLVLAKKAGQVSTDDPIDTVCRDFDKWTEFWSRASLEMADNLVADTSHKVEP